MARIRCLHLADLHLGWSPREWDGREAERQQERDELLKKAVDWALDPASGVQLVLIVGDLFETHRPPTSLVVRVMADLARLTKANIPVVTVPGNHDEITYHDSVYRKYSREWPGLLVTNPLVERISTLTIKETKCHLYGLAYTGGLTQVDGMIREFPRETETGVHIGLFHGSLDWAAGERSLPLSAQGLAAAGYDYVALGHIHRHQEKTVGNSLLVYPGMVEGKNLSDPGTGFLTVTEFGEGFPQLTRIPVKARAYKRLTLDVTGMAEQEFIQTLEKLSDPEAVVELSMQGVFSFLPDLSALRERYRDRFYYFEFRDETDFLDPGLLRNWAAEPTLRGAFLQRMMKRLAEASGQRDEKVIHLALAKGIAALQRGKEHGNG